MQQPTPPALLARAWEQWTRIKSYVLTVGNNLPCLMTENLRKRGVFLGFDFCPFSIMFVMRNLFGSSSEQLLHNCKENNLAGPAKLNLIIS